MLLNIGKAGVAILFIGALVTLTQPDVLAESRSRCVGFWHQQASWANATLEGFAPAPAQVQDRPQEQLPVQAEVVQQSRQAGNRADSRQFTSRQGRASTSRRGVGRQAGTQVPTQQSARPMYAQQN